MTFKPLAVQVDFYLNEVSTGIDPSLSSLIVYIYNSTEPSSSRVHPIPSSSFRAIPLRWKSRDATSERSRSPARHRDSLEINSTLSGWSSWIARTNSPASNTFLSPFALGIFVSTASSFYRRSRASFVFCAISFRALVLPREHGNWLLLLVDDMLSFFFSSSGQARRYSARLLRARNRLVFFRYTRWKAPENGILRENSNPRAIHGGLGLLLI